MWVVSEEDRAGFDQDGSTLLGVGFLFLCFLFFRFYVFIFRERGRAGERGRETSVCEKNIHQLCLECSQLGAWPATQARALTGNRTSNLSALNPLRHTSQGSIVNKMTLFCYLALRTVSKEKMPKLFQVPLTSVE